MNTEDQHYIVKISGFIGNNFDLCEGELKCRIVGLDLDTENKPIKICRLAYLIVKYGEDEGRRIAELNGVPICPPLRCPNGLKRS